MSRRQKLALFFMTMFFMLVVPTHPGEILMIIQVTLIYTAAFLLGYSIDGYIRLAKESRGEKTQTQKYIRAVRLARRLSHE